VRLQLRSRSGPRGPADPSFPCLRLPSQRPTYRSSTTSLMRRPGRRERTDGCLLVALPTWPSSPCCSCPSSSGSASCLRSRPTAGFCATRPPFALSLIIGPFAVCAAQSSCTTSASRSGLSSRRPSVTASRHSRRATWRSRRPTARRSAPGTRCQSYSPTLPCHFHISLLTLDPSLFGPFAGQRPSTANSLTASFRRRARSTRASLTRRCAPGRPSSSSTVT
jgi:hypothetical protein